MKKAEALFRYYISHIEMDVSKHCVETQSVCVMQPYSSLQVIINRNKSLKHKMPFQDTFGDRKCFDSVT